MSMAVNPQLNPEQRKLTYLSQMTTALENIARALNYEFGPLNPGEIVNPSEEWAKQAKENDEVERREIEIAELKRANKISALTTKIAVIGLLLSALFGGLQLLLDWQVYSDQKVNRENVQTIDSETQVNYVE